MGTGTGTGTGPIHRRLHEGIYRKVCVHRDRDRGYRDTGVCIFAPLFQLTIPDKLIVALQKRIRRRSCYR